MDYNNSTCNISTYEHCTFDVRCRPDIWVRFAKSIRGQIWRVNALLLVNAILTAAIVVIGNYGQRFRHHPFARSVFLGATTLFLPVMSYVVSTTTSFDNYIMGAEDDEDLSYWHLNGLAARCFFYTDFVGPIITWAFLVQVAVINTSVVVATDDREGQNTGPPFQLLVQGVWIFYLGIYNEGYYWLIQCASLALLATKMLFKYYALKKARRSFAYGCNPRLISGYMQKLRLREASQHGDPLAPSPSLPPLLVMGEEGRKVEKHPYGYVFKDDASTNNASLVTLDIIWQLDDMLLWSSPHLKDLCLSFALFKLLRCRFARYEPANVWSIATLNFFWNLVLEDGGQTRVFRVIADEIAFLHDYYNTSLPISYSKDCLPILAACISFLSIGYCIVAVLQTMSPGLVQGWQHIAGDFLDDQISCSIWCISKRLLEYQDIFFDNRVDSGIKAFGLVPVYLLVILVVMSEVREISSYICSNWTKVALICHYVSRPSSPSRVHWWPAFMLNSSCKMMKHWDEKIGQCSVLMLHERTSLFVFRFRHLLHLPERRTSKVKALPALKVCIMDALRRCNSSDRRLSNGASSLRQIHQAGESLLWACDGKGTSDVILAWHIASDILETRYPLQQQDGHDLSSVLGHKIAATHLSRYCAYLMATYPELLPDDDAWSKGLYKAVKKDAMHILAGCRDLVVSSAAAAPEDKVQKLAAVLERESKHEVLKKGVELGRQLVEMLESEEIKWKLLAGFWSEMILYIAPSDNLKGHSDAIARCGELITLLWAMLTHAGIIKSSAGGTGGTPSASGDM